MEVVLSKEEMLEEWLARRYDEPVRWACGEVVREHEAEFRIKAVREMRGWYLRLLDEGELRYLAPVDGIEGARLAPTSDGSMELVLPAGTRRVVAVRLGGWSRDAEIVEADSVSAQRQGNPYSRGMTEEPVAVMERGGSSMRLYSGTIVGERLTRLLIVRDEGPEVYRFDESALTLIERR